MRELFREFYRAHMTVVLRCLIVTAICAAVMFFTGTYSNDNLRGLAIAVTVFLGAVTLWTLFDILGAPRSFISKLRCLPEREWETLKNGLRNGLQSAQRLGKRWFFEEHLIYFAKRRIQFFRYDELCSAELNRNKLTVTLSNGEKRPFPFEADENPAVLVAVLRSRNGKLTASVDGSEVDFGKKRAKEKRTGK